MKRGHKLFIPVSICFFVFLLAQTSFAQTPCGSATCPSDQFCADAATSTCCAAGAYYCNGQCSSVPCGGLSQCGEDAIPSSGCQCGGHDYYSGYCCSNVYASGPCTTGESCGSTTCSTYEFCANAATGQCCASGAYYCNGQCSSAPCGGLSQCGEGAIPSTGCKCGGIDYYSGYCCSNVYVTGACGTGGLYTCADGPVPATGCICQGKNQYSGYCCKYIGDTYTWTDIPCEKYRAESLKCSAQGGTACASNQGCSGQTATATDTTLCCLGTCTTGTATCTDSDGGKNYYQRGSASVCGPEGICRLSTPPDSCMDSTRLMETYCLNNEYATEEYKCPYLCEYGACAEKGEPIGGQTDEHGCLIPGGYTWCETKRACIRPWEENCPEKQESRFICPSSSELNLAERECKLDGLKASIAVEGNCKVVRCVKEERICLPDEALRRQREECKMNNMDYIKVIVQGCPATQCVPAGEEKPCMTELPKEFLERCPVEPFIKSDSRGCIHFFECPTRGDERQIEYDDVFEVPPAAKILSGVLKLEKLKIQFDKLEKDMESIAAYYDKEGRHDEAERFHRAAGMIRATQEKIEGIRDGLRDRVEHLTVQDIIDVKREIKYITQVVFKDILFVILGGEEQEKEYTITDGAVQCGTDETCFEKQFRSCKPTMFTPGNQAITIEGIKGKTCRLHGKDAEGREMKCKVPDYAFIKIGPEILEYCKGDFVDYEMQQQGPKKEDGKIQCNSDSNCFEKAFRNCDPAKFRPEEDVKAEIVGMEDGKCRLNAKWKDATMQCLIEEYEKANPNDPTTFLHYCEGDMVAAIKKDIEDRRGFEFCTPEDEEQFNQCLADGGRPGSDPSKDRDCEVFTYCESPDFYFLQDIKGLGQLTTIDFETTADGKALENGDKVTGDEWESLGVIFETPSEDYLKAFGPMHPFNPLGTVSLSPGIGPFEAGGPTHDDLTITFTEPVRAAGLYLLDLGDTDERESITFYDTQGNILHRISPWPASTFGNPAPGVFVSLIQDGIAKIEIKENTQDGDDIAYDNLYFVKGRATTETVAAAKEATTEM